MQVLAFAVANLERFHCEWNRRNNLSLRGAQRRSNLRLNERTAVRQAGDCFGAARLAMTVFTHGENALAKPDTLLPAVRALGKRHVGYGVTPPHSATVGAALLATLEAGRGGAFTPEVKAAWTTAYTVIAGEMQAAAKDVAAADRARRTRRRAASLFNVGHQRPVLHQRHQGLQPVGLGSGLVGADASDAREP